MPFWEVYGDWNGDPEKLGTDVFYLLNESGAMLRAAGYNSM
jgi:hypothetical protein